MVEDKDRKIPITHWENLQQQDNFCDELNSMEDTINNLNNALQKALEEKIELQQKYDRETEFLIKENVKLKHELGEYKKKYGDL